MKLRSNIITGTDVWQAFAKARADNKADIWVDALHEFKPRREAHGVEFWANSHYGRRLSGRNVADRMPAASWTDYGYVIAHLYNLDPHAQIGHYDNEADFVAKVRSYVPRGQSLDFLLVLANIDEYGTPCPACGSWEADCEPGCAAVPARLEGT